MNAPPFTKDSMMVYEYGKEHRVVAKESMENMAEQILWLTSRVEQLKIEHVKDVNKLNMLLIGLGISISLGLTTFATLIYFLSL